MKKTTSILLALAMLFALVACTQSDPQGTGDPTPQTSTDLTPPSEVDDPPGQPPPEWQFYEDDEQVEFLYPYDISGFSREPFVEVGRLVLEWGMTDSGACLPTTPVRHADMLVIEFEGYLSDGYRFWFIDEIVPGWWYNGDGITVEEGKLIFDYRDLGAVPPGFCLFLGTAEDTLKPTRVYLDIYPPNEEPNPAPKNIYVDAGNDDIGDGTQENPFQSLTDAANAAKTSDTIIVADGVYHGSFSLPSGTRGRPTTLQAAEGASPVITSAIPFGGSWSVYEDNIYVADVPSDIAGVMETEFPQLFVDGVSMVEARYPNIGSDMSTIMDQKRVVAARGTTGNTIVAPDDSIPSDIEGATAVFWPGYDGHIGWFANASTVVSVNGRNIELVDFSVPPEAEASAAAIGIASATKIAPGNPFYITGALALLDAPGEYYYDKDNEKLYFYAPGGTDPSELNLSLGAAKQFTIDLDRRDYVVVDGFDVFGGGINIVGSYNTVRNCSILYANHYNMDQDSWNETRNTHGSIMLYGTKNTVTRCEIGYDAGIGINTWGYYNKITDNIIHNCNYFPGGFAAINVDQSRYIEISHNSISYSGSSHISLCGYNHLSYPGLAALDDPGDWAYTGCVIRNNHFRNHLVLCSDGAAIYFPHTNGGGTEVYNNYVEFGTKGDQGSDRKLMVGIYGDMTSHDYIFRNNIIDARSGIGEKWEVWGINTLMPARNVQVLNNTIIGTPAGYCFWGSAETELDMLNIIVRDNLFVDTGIDYDYGVFEKGRFVHLQAGANDTDGIVPFPIDKSLGTVTSSGNVRGTIDEHFKPIGDTPTSAGAIPPGGEMFDYGATWTR